MKTKYERGMDFVGERIRAGKKLSAKEIQKACKVSPAYASIIIMAARHRGILVSTGKLGEYCSRSLYKHLNSRNGR